MKRRLLAGLATVALVLSAVAMVAAPAEAGGRLLRYHGVRISAPRQVDARLPGAPVGFKRFISGKVAALRRHRDPSCPAPSVGVNKLRTDGFARGDVSDCGGYIAIWKRTRAGWREVIGTQEVVACARLRRFAIPSAILEAHPRCWNGSAVVPYHHA